MAPRSQSAPPSLADAIAAYNGADPVIAGALLNLQQAVSDLQNAINGMPPGVPANVASILAAIQANF